jgi:hypothetical protein
MRTIVQDEQLSRSYLKETTSKRCGQILGAANRGRAAQTGSRRMRCRVLRLGCINDEDSRYAPGKRPRSPT